MILRPSSNARNIGSDHPIAVCPGIWDRPAVAASTVQDDMQQFPERCAVWQLYRLFSISGIIAHTNRYSAELDCDHASHPSSQIQIADNS